MRAVWQAARAGGTPRLRRSGARSSTSFVVTGYPWPRRCPTHALQHPQVGDRWTVTGGLAPAAARASRGSPRAMVNMPRIIVRRSNRIVVSPKHRCHSSGGNGSLQARLDRDHRDPPHHPSWGRSQLGIRGPTHRRRCPCPGSAREARSGWLPAWCAQVTSPRLTRQRSPPPADWKPSRSRTVHPLDSPPFTSQSRRSTGT
jgi:hypothetical protein